MWKILCPSLCGQVLCRACSREIWKEGEFLYNKISPQSNSWYGGQAMYKWPKTDDIMFMYRTSFIGPVALEGVFESTIPNLKDTSIEVWFSKLKFLRIHSKDLH